MSREQMLVLWDPACLDHHAPDGVFERPPSPLLAHQVPTAEGPVRIDNIRALLERSPLADALIWTRPEPASDAQILRFHDESYLADLKDADREGRWMTGTTYLARGGLAGARIGAGGAMAAARHVVSGDGKLAYVLSRPPAHHAQPDRADGYCFVNSIGLAALEARELGAERVAVIDWDVHHGNGTQEGFYQRADVLTVSLHMDHGSWGASHPQTGDVDEVGEGEGRGFNLNLPLPMGAGDRAYELAMERCVLPFVREFRPDLLIIANGQDAGQFDPNGRQCVSMAGFHRLGGLARELALELCGGRMVMTQEGGYNPAYAAYCAYASLAGVLGKALEIEDPLAYYPDDRVRAEADVEALAARHPLLKG
jgi:acetoin utilization deacetylase AcuC-like enzyme